MSPALQADSLPAEPQESPYIYILIYTYIHMCTDGLPRWHSGRESAWLCWRQRFDPWIGKIPWRRKWQPPCSSILAWKIPWIEVPDGVQSLGSQRVGWDWACNTYVWIYGNTLFHILFLNAFIPQDIEYISLCYALVLVAQSCPTLCDPIDFNNANVIILFLVSPLRPARA